MQIAKHIIFILSVISVISAKSQALPEKALSTPEKYIIPIDGISYKRSDQIVDTKVWSVYCDRDYIRTTKEAGGGGVFKTLTYLDRYIVVEETRSYIRIVKDANISYDRTLSPQAEDYGWVEKDNMLLWNHCLINEETYNKRKAILFNNQFTENYFKDYQDQTVPFQILYIFKESSDSYLLGKQPYIISTSNNIEDYITGWVDESNVIIWENNMVLEPNWDEKAVLERTTKGIKVILSSSKTESKSYARRSSIPSGSHWEGYYEYREDGNWLRFPIIGAYKGYVKTCHYQLGDSIAYAGQYNISDKYMGYAYISYKALEFPAFKHLMFVSKAELSQLIELYDNLNSIIESPNRRNETVEVIKDQLIYRGIYLPDSVEFYTLKQINQYLFGAYNTLSLFNEYKIGDFASVDFVTDEMFDQFFIESKRKIKELQEIINQMNYYYSFKMNGIMYYWVNVEYLM